MNNIKKQIDYYHQYQQTIDAQHMGRTIVINDKLEIEEFDNEEIGYKTGLSKYGYGNFLLKKISEPSKQGVNIVFPIITTI